MLFDGKDLSKWNNGDKWEIKDGYAVVQRTRHHSRRTRSATTSLHVEFATPEKVDGQRPGPRQ